MLPFIAFIVSCFAVNEAYFHAFKSMEVSSAKFCALSEARQFYVLKNLIKAYYLAVLVVIGALFAFVPIVLYGRYDNRSIRILASLYVSNDFVGLWRVEKLATTTRLHHMTSFVFLLMAWQADFPAACLPSAQPPTAAWASAGAGLARAIATPPAPSTATAAVTTQIGRAHV